MKVINLTQGDVAWLSWRKGGITATDAAILLGRSPYKTRWRLWAEKVGFAREVDLSLNPLVRRGRENEDKARQVFEAQHGEILLPACVESSVNPLMRASLDGLTSRNEPVELKCPSDKVWQEVCNQGASSTAYMLYYCQVQHQLLVTGAKRGFLVFWHESHGIKTFEVLPDLAMLKELIQAAATFWQQVLKREEPVKDPERDLYIPEGEEISNWIFAAEQYRLHEAEIAVLKERIADLKQRQSPHLETMKSLMGEHFHADYCGVMVTRYRQRGKVDYKKLITDKAGPVDDADVEKYREKSSERCRVTITDSLTPKDIVDESVIAPLAEVPEEVESYYF
jgi:putative phage-type endonuclease